MESRSSVRRARALRKIMTPPELALWFQLKQLRERGWHFRRQSPEAGFVLDFVCRSEKLVVEVDGAHHSQRHQAEHDQKRDAILAERGFRVLRFWAAEVEGDIDAVMRTIVDALQPRTPRRSIPPRNGEGVARSATGGAGRRYRQLVRLGLRKRDES